MGSLLTVVEIICSRVRPMRICAWHMRIMRVYMACTLRILSQHDHDERDGHDGHDHDGRLYCFDFLRICNEPATHNRSVTISNKSARSADQSTQETSVQQTTMPNGLFNKPIPCLQIDNGYCCSIMSCAISATTGTIIGLRCN